MTPVLTSQDGRFLFFMYVLILGTSRGRRVTAASYGGKTIFCSEIVTSADYTVEHAIAEFGRDILRVARTPVVAASAKQRIIACVSTRSDQETPYHKRVMTALGGGTTVGRRDVLAKYKSGQLNGEGVVGFVLHDYAQWEAKAASETVKNPVLTVKTDSEGEPNEQLTVKTEELTVKTEELTASETPLGEIAISDRIVAALNEAGISTVEALKDVFASIEGGHMKVAGIGKGSIAAIAEALSNG